MVLRSIAFDLERSTEEWRICVGVLGRWFGMCGLWSWRNVVTFALCRQTRRHGTPGRALRSGVDDLESRDVLKVTNVAGRDVEAKV